MGVLERFELSLVNNLLPLQILLNFSQLFLKSIGLCLRERFSLYQLQILEIQVSYFLLGIISFGFDQLNVLPHLPIIAVDIRLIIGGHAAEVKSTILHNPYQLAQSAAVKILQVLVAHEPRKLTDVGDQMFCSIVK